MSWVVAASLLKLDAEIKSRFPKRDTRSDGFIGDAAHQNRGSEHNPDERGVVRAGDWTVTTGRKYDKKIADAILKAAIGDARVHYVIHAGYIYSRNHGWRKRTYHGSNPHSTHVHISILNAVSGNWGLQARKGAESNVSSWGLAGASAPVKPAPAPAPAPPKTGVSIGKYRVVTNGGRLNGRAAPGVSARRTMTAANGYVLDIVETRNGWAKSTGGHWYSMQYLRAVVPDAGRGRYRVTTRALPLTGRAGPGTKYRKTMTAARGYVLNVVEVRSGWAKSAGGHWYSMQYLVKL